MDFLARDIKVHGEICRLQLWDTAGQEQYRSFIPSYLKDALSAIFVFDIASTHFSIQMMNHWIIYSYGFNYLRKITSMNWE